MSIISVTVEDGCISCGLCEEKAPKVFEVDDVSTVIEGADFLENEDGIREAADECPVEVIVFEEQ